MEPALDTDVTAATARAGRVSGVDIGSVFAVGWATANIVHLLNQTGGRLPAVSWLNLLVALWVFGRPGSAHRLVALAGAQLVDTVWLAPYVPDHQILMASVNVVIVSSYVAMRRPRSVKGLVHRVAPAARLLLLVAYAAAAIAKYNTDFIETTRTCAVFIAEHATYGLIAADSPLAPVQIWVTIVVESLVPILLLVPFTRRWGVLFAATFHFVVSLSPAIGVADFTYTLWPLFALFLTDRDVVAIGGRFVAQWRNSTIVMRLHRVPRWVLGVAFVVGVWLASVGSYVAMILWLFTTLAGLGVLLATFGTLRDRRADPQPLGRPTLGQGVLVAAMLLLVAGPYLGFGTSSRFTMFSGLRTEGPGTNHLFLPSVHLIESQNDALIVRTANGESVALETAAERHAALPVVEIRRSLQHEDASATFETLDGERIVVRAGDDHPLREPPPFWESKTQHYRPFKVEGVTDPELCSN